MIKGIHLIEDVISKDKQDELENYFKGNAVKWNEVNNVWYRKDLKTPQSVITSDEIQSNHIIKLFEEIKTNTLARLELKELQTYRIKVNKLVASRTNTLTRLELKELQTYRIKVNKLVASRKYLHYNNKVSIHIDRDIEHISMIYYITTADGDTKFYTIHNGATQNIMEYVKNNEFSRFQEIRSITPKKGSIVVFDGHTPHHSCYPIISDRFVINYNIVPNPTVKTLI